MPTKRRATVLKPIRRHAGGTCGIYANYAFHVLLYACFVFKMPRR